MSNIRFTAGVRTARSIILSSVGALLVSVSSSYAEIPEIDSSGWAADPVKHGMTAAEYINAESNTFMANFIEKVGVNKWSHFKGLSKAEDKWVVSPNNDTIYSIAVVNARDGFTLTLPDVGDRFLSTQIISEDHMTPFYIYGGGKHEFSTEDIATNYVVVGVRMGTDGSDKDVAYVTEELQPNYVIEGVADTDDLPRADVDKMMEVRKAMLVEYDKLSDTFDAMKKSTDLFTDWERFTYITAGAWGLSEDENAMYKPYALKGVKGGECYTATYPAVPADEFFSITVYGPDKYLMANKDNLVSSNRNAKANDDGSFTIAYGDERCRDLAPNYAYTPKDGWSFLLRAYKPDVEAFKAYQMPGIEKAE